VLPHKVLAHGKIAEQTGRTDCKKPETVTQNNYVILTGKPVLTGTPADLSDTICTGFPGSFRQTASKNKLLLTGGTKSACVSPAKLPNTEKSEKILEIQNIPCYNGICIWIT